MKIALNVWKILTIVMILLVVANLYFTYTLFGITGKLTDILSKLGTNGGKVTALSKTVGDFYLTDQDVCKKDGKPIIYLFGTTWCPHCQWAKPILEKVVQKFGSEIDARLYELDQQNAPAEDEAIYENYNPQGSIPTFVFGCKYFRVGNDAHESANDTTTEEKEFTAVICKLTGGKPASVCSEVSSLVSQVQ